MPTRSLISSRYSRSHLRPLGCLVTLACMALAPMALADQWSGSVGAGVAYAPDYAGSDDYEARALPVLNLAYGDQLSINLRDGIEWHALRQGNWSASPFIGYTFGRDNKGDLGAFEKIDGGATLGLRVSYQDGPWRYSVAGSRAVTGDMEGATFSASATLRTPLSERLLLVLSPSVNYSNERWTQSLYGVSDLDSARSGVTTYAPDGGYWRLGANASLSYALTPEWTATGFVGATRLTGNAADSPIVDELGSPWQALSGVSLTYRF